MLLKGDCPGMPCSCPCAPALLGGRGLFRVSGRFDAEDEGVIVGDWLASLDAVLLGEAVPSLESFFFDDLLESFPRDRTLWLKRFIFEESCFSVQPRGMAGGTAVGADDRSMGRGPRLSQSRWMVRRRGRVIGNRAAAGEGRAQPIRQRAGQTDALGGSQGGW